MPFVLTWTESHRQPGQIISLFCPFPLPYLVLSITSPLFPRPPVIPFQLYGHFQDNGLYLGPRERQAGKHTHFHKHSSDNTGIRVLRLFLPKPALCCSYWQGLDVND